MSQCDVIRDALLRGDEITPMDALLMYGTMRLAGRVHELRQRGLDVRSRMIGTGRKRVASYWMERAV